MPMHEKRKTSNVFVGAPWFEATQAGSNLLDSQNRQIGAKHQQWAWPPMFWMSPVSGDTYGCFLIGVPPVTIHFRLGFSMIFPFLNQPASLGYPHDYGNLYIPIFIGLRLKQAPENVKQNWAPDPSGLLVLTCCRASEPMSGFQTTYVENWKSTLQSVDIFGSLNYRFGFVSLLWDFLVAVC